MRTLATDRRRLGLLLAPLLLCLAGCSPLFDTEYADSGPYEVPSAVEAEDAAYEDISNYAALRQAVISLVADHVESAQLQFMNYDGDLSQDISTACWEVKSSTALGAFAVDYISYNLSRIVSYYQAELNITYKRSESQVAALEQAPTVSMLGDRLARAMAEGEPYLVLEIADASATAETLRGYVSNVYYANAALCPVLPEAEISLHPETGVDRIAEISLNYALEREELTQRREALASALEDMLAALAPRKTGAETIERPAGPADQAEQLRSLCRYLILRCRVSDDGGSTAWDALTAGTADSQGMALGLEAGCQALGLECRIVTGRMASQPHYWNIVTLDGESYHVDISGGDLDVFLAGDARLWGAYWWDTSQHPVCPRDFGARDDAAAEVDTAPEDS